MSSVEHAEQPRPLKTVQPNVPFTLEIDSYAHTFYDDEMFVEVVARIPLSVEGQGGAVVTFHKNLDFVRSLGSRRYAIPTGAESMPIPISMIIDVDPMTAAQAERAKCIISYGDQSYSMRLAHDTQDEEGKGEAWFDSYYTDAGEFRDIIFPPDTKILSQILFTIDLGTSSASD